MATAMDLILELMDDTMLDRVYPHAMPRDDLVRQTLSLSVLTTHTAGRLLSVPLFSLLLLLFLRPQTHAAPAIRQKPSRTGDPVRVQVDPSHDAAHPAVVRG
jgi:hypothetical protein